MVHGKYMESPAPCLFKTGGGQPSNRKRYAALIGISSGKRRTLSLFSGEARSGSYEKEGGEDNKTRRFLLATKDCFSTFREAKERAFQIRLEYFSS